MILDPKQRELLTHMLGAGSHIKKRQWGYRNRFCAEVNGEHYQEMLDMEAGGLVTSGCFINGGSMRYFHATIEGCKAIGLTKSQIKRAMEN